VIEFIQQFPVERTSFWFGFLAGMLFFWFLSRVRTLGPRAILYFRQQLQAARESLTESVENRLRSETHNYAQHQHLASWLFSLDEILIEPHLLTPPTFWEENDESGQNAASLTIPYMPDFPEMASIFGSPKLTLPEALQAGANLLLIGPVGIGKSVALAHLASLLARRDNHLGSVVDLCPLYFHAADLLFNLPREDPATILSGCVSGYTSALTTPRLPKLINELLVHQRVICLVDGLDEVDPDSLLKVREFLAVLIEKYPSIRIVTAASTDSYDGLAELGLSPVALAAWDVTQYTQFIQVWQSNWLHYVGLGDQNNDVILDPIILHSWLSIREPLTTPLEITLKVWAAYAGDMLGSELPQLIEAHIRRLSIGVTNAQMALERLAAQMVINTQPVVKQEEAETWVADFNKMVASIAVEESQEEDTKTQAKERVGSAYTILNHLIQNGLLISHTGSTIRLIHPVFMGYMASRSLANGNNPTILLEKPVWAGRCQTLAFWGCFGDATPVVENIVAQAQKGPLYGAPLYSGPLRLVRWLHVTPKNLPWRSVAMRALVGLVQREVDTLGIGARIITGLALSSDPGIPAYFRQITKSMHPYLRRLGALGIGLLFDTKGVNELTNLLEDMDPNVGRASCLSLVALGEKNALDIVISVLLNGSELMRRAAAEALTNDKLEGHPALLEATTMEDLLVRRAAIYGLAHIRTPEAIQILEKVQIEDAQWVVRTAATQTLEELQQPNRSIPKPMPAIKELPWLIAFASKQGEGVMDGEQALDLIGQALNQGEEAEFVQAMQYISQHANDRFSHSMLQYFYKNTGEMREAAYNTLWHMAAAGIDLPSPMQYGLG
jgi:hypothetical protein